MFYEKFAFSDLHGGTGTIIYIGPKRDDKARPSLPIVKLNCVIPKTKIEDLINSYKYYAKLEGYEITGLHFNNKPVRHKDLVLGVIGNFFHRNYLMFEDDDIKELRNLNNVVQLVEGEVEVKTQTKKKKKKRKGKSQRRNQECTTQNPIVNPEEFETNKYGPGEKAKNSKVQTIQEKVASSHDKLALESSLKEKTDLLSNNKSEIERFIETKSKEMKELLVKIENVENENNKKEKQMTAIDTKVVDLELKISKLRGNNIKITEEKEKTGNTLETLKRKKEHLENSIEIEMNKLRRKEKEHSLRSLADARKIMTIKQERPKELWDILGKIDRYDVRDDAAG